MKGAIFLFFLLFLMTHVIDAEKPKDITIGFFISKKIEY